MPQPGKVRNVCRQQGSRVPEYRFAWYCSTLFGVCLFLVCGVLFLAAFCVVPPTGAGKMIAVTRQLLEFQMAYTEPLSA